MIGGQMVSWTNLWSTGSGTSIATARLNNRGVNEREGINRGGGVYVTGVDETTGEKVSTIRSDNNPDVPSYSWMYYVGNPDYASANQNFVPNQVLVDALKEYRDNRLFAYCDLNGYKGDREGDPDSFDSYFGVPFGLASPDAVYDIAAFCCSVDARYCEPQATYGIITTARTLLVEAEPLRSGGLMRMPMRCIRQVSVHLSLSAVPMEWMLTSRTRKSSFLPIRLRP